MILERILKSKIADKKRALEALELIAQVHGGKKEQRLLQTLLAHANRQDFKRLGLIVIGGVAALSVAESFARSRISRIAMGRELKKQLAPINRKLDELEKQNEELKKQNEELKRKLK